MDKKKEDMDKQKKMPVLTSERLVLKPFTLNEAKEAATTLNFPHL